MRVKLATNSIASAESSAHLQSESAAVGASVDPITLQLIRGSLRSARLECELLIERTAMSAFIREKKDYTVSFLDHLGQEIYGETLGSDILGCVWDCYPPETMHAGDVYWYNDPYISKGSISHTPDMVFITPVFFQDELVAYCHSFAHFWDLGGSRPGSIGPANTEIFHDGTLVPPIRIVDRGKAQRRSLPHHPAQLPVSRPAGRRHPRPDVRGHRGPRSGYWKSLPASAKTPPWRLYVRTRWKPRNSSAGRRWK